MPDLLKRLRRRLKGYRTWIFNGVWMFGSAFCVVAPEVLIRLSSFEWGIVLSPRSAALVVLFLSIANIILRKITTTPVGDNGEKATASGPAAPP